jgi:hypothetical protein
MKLLQLKNMAGKLYRSIDNQQRYIKHRDATLRRYASYEDYVKIRHMGFEAVAGADGRKVAKKMSDIKSWYFSKNIFPYAIGDGVRHYILFAVKPMSSKNTEALLGKLLGGKEYIYFRNPPGSRSLPGLWHVQVFVKSL